MFFISGISPNPGPYIQAIPDYLFPPKMKDVVDKSPGYDGTGSSTPENTLFGAMGCDSAEGACSNIYQP